MAAEVFELAIAERMDRGADVASPSLLGGGEVLVTMWPLLAAKVALYCALARGHVSKSELARRLGIDEAVVRRMLHARRATPIDDVASAPKVLGVSLQVTAVSPGPVTRA